MLNKAEQHLPADFGRCADLSTLTRGQRRILQKAKKTKSTTKFDGQFNYFLKALELSLFDSIHDSSDEKSDKNSTNQKKDKTKDG